ncbi:MAG: hypothetical protein HC927_01115 [Deltaproteobacteria bacterium]|nr:hypothetical protein [Deltaproteobacteria bacterium]
MTRRNLTLAITGLSFAAILVSLASSDVQAAKVQQPTTTTQAGLSEVPTFTTTAALIQVFQAQYVMDPRMVEPMIFVASAPPTQESALINEDAAHLLN